MKSFSTHAFLALLCFFFTFSPLILNSQIIWSEDFETNGEGVRYASPHLFFDPISVDDYWGRIEGDIMTYADPPSPGSSIALVGQGSNNNQTGQYTAYHGSFYFAGEDLDDVAGNGNPDGVDEKEILISGIDISNETGLSFKGLFAAGAETPCGASTYDAPDYIKVYYSVDNAPFVLGMCFSPDIECTNPGNTLDEPLHRDPDCNGDGGEGTMLVNAFQEFSFPLPNGTSLELKIVVSSDHDGEEMALDYLRVESAGAPPCTDPVISNVSKSDDPCQAGQPVTLSVSGSLNDADDWHWYTEACGQTPAGTGAQIVVNPATTTTYFVRGEPACGDPLPCETITVFVGIDEEAPVISCPANQVVSGNNNCEAILADYTGQAVVNDNCDPDPAVTQSPAAGTEIDGTQTVTLYAEDAAGNIGSCTFNVSVEDNTPPVLSLPDDATLECGDPLAPPVVTCGPQVVLKAGITMTLPVSGTATLAAAQFDGGSLNGCGAGNLLFSFSPNPANTSKVYNCTHIGTNPVNIWVIDGNGNKHSATSQISVQDPYNYCNNSGNGCQPVPVLFSKLHVNLQPDGNVTLEASNWDAGSQNTCQGGSLTFSFSANTLDLTHTFSCADIGTQNLEIWVTDGLANQSKATVAIDVRDYWNYCSAPSADCDHIGLLHQGMVVNLPPNRTAVLYAEMFNAGSVDYCETGGLNFAFETPVLSPAKLYTCADLGAHTETIRVIDEPGTYVSLEVIVQVTDREGSCEGAGFASATDNCDLSPQITYSDATSQGVCPVTQVITRTWTATDDAGNSVSANQIISIEDTTPPVVICPDDQTGVLGPNCSFTLPSYIDLVTAGDDCNGDLDFEQTPAAGQSLSGSSPIVIIVSDACGNATPCQFQLTLTDDEAPVLVCPADQEAIPNGNCGFVMEDYTGLVQASDNCDASLTLVQSPAPGTIQTVSVTVTISATDDGGNTGSCSFEVTVGSLGPEFSFTPGNITVDCQSDVPGNQGVEAFDDCDGEVQVTFTQTGLPLNCPGEGTVTNTWTASDSDGNTISHTQIVTVEDNTAPQLSGLPSNITVACLDDVPGNQGITATDNCGGVITPAFFQSLAPPCSGSGVVTNTWVAQDCAGNSVVHIQTVTIDDNQAPVFSATPQNTTVTCSANVPGSQGVTATDNCGDPVTVNFSQSNLPSCPGQGVVQNTWTATDCAGNTASYTQTITIQDNLPPLLSSYPPSGIASCIQDAPGNPGITATDNCGGTITVGYSQTIASNCAGSGTVTNTWTATDCAGNTTTHSQVITIDDNTAPVLSAFPQNTTVTCLSAVPGNPGITATDNCAGNIAVVFTQTLPGGCTGVASNTWTATDCAGNTASYTQLVTIIDNTAPVFSASPPNLTFSCSSQVPGSQGITATDNCGGNIPVQFSQSPLPSCSGQGTVINTWTATDCAGNTATIIQTITIDDNTAPVLSSQPANLSVACEDDVPGAQGITAGDNCGQAVTVVFTQTGFPIPYPNPGTITNTWTATDCAGNIKSYSQIVTVDDNVVPVAFCQNITVNLNLNGEATISPADIDAESFDNCGIASYSIDQSLFTCDEVGVFPVVLTVSDLFENTASCTAYVSVVASFNCPAPGISYYGGPSISDPCTCIGNGQFEEEVVVGPSGQGQVWTIVSTNLRNPNTQLPYPAGTQLTEIPQGGGQSIYVIQGIHLDGIGYSMVVQSASYPGLTLSISNVCYYPEPEILGLDGPFCIYSDPVTLEGNVGGVELDSEGFTIDGDPATVFDPFDLGVGNYLVVYTVDAGTASPGDPSDPGCVASTSQLVQVLQTPSSLACNSLLTVAVDENCEALITPDMILEGTYPCFDDYSVTVKHNINVIPNPVPGSYIGLTLTVTIKHLPSGNSCWGQVILEDNLAPTFDCPTEAVQIACSAELADVPPPLAFDNCTPVELLLIDEIYVDTDPCDDNTAVVHRVWIAVDNYDNESLPCTQVVEIIRPDDVDFPNDIIWSCDQYNQHPSILAAVSLHPVVLALQSGTAPINAAGITNPNVLNNTGSGKPEGLDGPYCSYNYTHSDQYLDACGSTFKIIRTWTVLDWCTGLVITSNDAGEDNVQVITVMDQTAPSISRPPFTVVANIQGNFPQPCTSQGLLLPPVVSDNCNSFTVLIFTSVGEAIYINGQDGAQGGFIPAPGLPIGTHPVTYQAIDECNNIQEIIVQVTVIDNVSPVAICDEITTVTLSSDGKAIVSASVFDDGSTDNCCLDFFQVRRMQDNCGVPSNTTFGPAVTFCCADVGQGPIQVVFRVWDCFDNYNECMVLVIVEDKLPPFVITCPSNQTITCETYQTQLAGPLQQGNYSVLNAYGTPLFYDNCDYDVEQDVTININNCSEGSITRHWTATDPFGNAPANCTQVINVQHVSNWVVEFPANITANCTDAALPPFGEPEIFFDDCELIGTSFDDQTFNAVGNSCYLIVRTWTVINWCLYDDFGYNAFLEKTEIVANQDFDGDGDKDSRTFKDGVNNGSGPDGYIVYNQTITVVDTEDPIFQVDDMEVCINETDCNTNVTLPTPTVEDCSNNITIEVTSNLPNGSSFGPYLNVPPGTYTANYTVSDECNNYAYQQISIVVVDCKNPTPVCMNGLVAEIMQTGMVPVTADMLDAGSYDNCPGALQVSFSSDVNDTLHIFTCDELGLQPVEIWVTDASGNQDFCITFVEIQDNMGACTQPTMITVAGAIEVENGNAVSNVMVDVNGGMASALTSPTGTFSFELPAEQDYTITPMLDVFPSNGVTTLDMVFIQKHILGIQLLNSPYKIIAADVNKSGAVTTIDLVIIQKIILILIPNFPSNTSWRFVDQDYVFPNPQIPWQGGPFPEVINYNNLTVDQLFTDFVAIKVGDVNLSANPNNLDDGALERSYAGELEFVTDERELKAGEDFTASIRLRPATVLGYQFTLDFPTEAIEWESVIPGLVSEEHFGWALADEGAITANWLSAEPAQLDEHTILFQLKGKAKMDGKLSEWLRLSSRFTPKEAYNGNGEYLDARLLFEGSEEEQSGFALFQNRPNPFRESTEISFLLPETCSARLTVWDASGKVMQTTEGIFQKGYNSIELQRLNVSGVLYYKLETPTHVAVKKMIALE